MQAAEFTGSRRQNYESAVHHADKVEAALRDQAARGQVLILPEAEAVAK